MQIDATNQFVTQGLQIVVADLGGRGSSEIVAELTPGARVVKAIHVPMFSHPDEVAHIILQATNEAVPA